MQANVLFAGPASQLQKIGERKVLGRPQNARNAFHSRPVSLLHRSSHQDFHDGGRLQARSLAAAGAEIGLVAGELALALLLARFLRRLLGGLLSCHVNGSYESEASCFLSAARSGTPKRSERLIAVWRCD